MLFLTIALVLVALLLAELACYWSARRRTEVYVQSILASQYPQGCTCIHNALMPNPRCPHHGDREG